MQQSCSPRDLGACRKGQTFDDEQTMHTSFMRYPTCYLWRWLTLVVVGGEIQKMVGFHCQKVFATVGG
jgi:hypothetical protein